MEAGGGNAGGGSSSFDDFNIDKQEYQSVFKVFDKNNSGEISIGQVFELINKFDQAQKLTEQQASSSTQANNNNGAGGGMGAGGALKNQDGTMRSNTIGGAAGVGGYKGATKVGANQPQNNKNANMNGNSPTIKKQTAQQTGATNANGFGMNGGAGLQLKPTAIDHLSSKSPRMISGVKPSQQNGMNSQQKDPQLLSEEVNFGNVPLQDEKKSDLTFPNGKTTLKFDDFFSIVKDSCADKEQAENYLIHAFSMFDRKKYQNFFLSDLNFRKGYINNEDLKEVFKLLGESVTDDEVNTMIKIAGVKSNDKINFKEFVDFFNKVD